MCQQAEQEVNRAMTRPPATIFRRAATLLLAICAIPPHQVAAQGRQTAPAARMQSIEGEAMASSASSRLICQSTGVSKKVTWLGQSASCVCRTSMFSTDKRSYS